MTDALFDEAAERLGRRVLATTPIRSDIALSFEFFPPATAEGLSLLEKSAQELARFEPNFASVTYGAGGSGQEKTFAAVDRLTAMAQFPVAGHLTCVGATKATIDRVIDDYATSGVNHIVALRGDTPADLADVPNDGSPRDGYGTAAELVEGIRQRTDGNTFEVSVAAYPEVHPKATSAQADLDNLKKKLDAGADRAITQFFFDTDVFLRFLERARAAGITAPIVPGIMPITSFTGICKFSNRSGTHIPKWMYGLFAGLDDAPEVRELVAATVAAEQCKRLVEHGVREFHFYTMNKPNLTAATCRILGVVGKQTHAGAGSRAS